MTKNNLSDDVQVRCPNCNSLAMKTRKVKRGDRYVQLYCCLNIDCERKSQFNVNRQDLKICKIEGCLQKSKIKGLCKKHYNKQYYQKNKKNENQTKSKQR